MNHSPATAARPVSWLFWPIAVLLTPFAPARLAPRLLASSWTKALLTSGVACVAVVLITLAGSGGAPAPFYGDDCGDLAFQEKLRTPLCRVISQSYLSDIPFAFAALTPLTPALATVAFGVALAPLVIRRDDRRPCWDRSIRAGLWATSCVLPVGLALIASVSALDRLCSAGRLSGLLETTAAVFVSVMWWTRTTLRIASEPPNDESSTPRPPDELRCEQCGYVLAGLSLDSRCPECGLTIAESAPGRRRRATAFWRTLLCAAAQPSYARTLAVRAPTAPAIRFASRVIAILLFITMAALLASFLRSAHAMNGRFSLNQTFPTLLSLASTFWLLAHAMLAFYALFPGSDRIRDRRPVVHAVCYSTAVLVPGVFFGILLIFAAAQWAPHVSFTVPGLPRLVPLYAWIAAGVVVLNITWWSLRAKRGLRDVRYANA